MSASELGAHAIAAALQRSGVSAEQIENVIVGQVIQAGAGQGPARQSSIGAGIGWDVPTVTVNKLCLSGLTAQRWHCTESSRSVFDTVTCLEEG